MDLLWPAGILIVALCMVYFAVEVLAFVLGLLVYGWGETVKDALVSALRRRFKR